MLSLYRTPKSRKQQRRTRRFPASISSPLRWWNLTKVRHPSRLNVCVVPTTGVPQNEHFAFVRLGCRHSKLIVILPIPRIGFEVPQIYLGVPYLTSLCRMLLQG